MRGGERVEEENEKKRRGNFNCHNLAVSYTLKEMFCVGEREYLGHEAWVIYRRPLFKCVV